MKFFTTTTQFSKFTILFIILTFTLVGCLKKLDEGPKASISGLCLIHASPTSEKCDIYLNQTRVNQLDFSFTNKINYVNAYSGNRTVNLTKKGVSTYLKSENFNLQPQMAYSLFVIDKLENVKFLFLTDTLTKPPVGKAKIRFVNLSPDSGALNLALEGATIDFIIDKKFKENSSFKTINKFERVTFIIKNKETGAVETTLANIKIEEGKNYTLWVKGLKTASDNFKIGAEIYTHK